jgi:hypothetical protein
VIPEIQYWFPESAKPLKEFFSVIPKNPDKTILSTFVYDTGSLGNVLKKQNNLSGLSTNLSSQKRYYCFLRKSAKGG